jgi:hypothetical protein
MDLHHVWLHQLAQDFLSIEQSHLSSCALYVRVNPLAFILPQLLVHHQFFQCHWDEADYFDEEKPHSTQH